MKKLFILNGLLITLFGTAANAFAQQGGYGGQGWQHPMMWGGGWFGGPLMLLFWLLAIVLVVMGLRWAFKDRGAPGDVHCAQTASGGSGAVEVLKRRYASGEIERDQFYAMKKDLEA